MAVNHVVTTDRSVRTFSWLHLTDFHEGQDLEKPLWSSIEGEFFDSLATLHREAGPWDAVFFTGDFVQQGKPIEYDTVSLMLNRLMARLAELGSQPLLFTVPGNHDLVRPNAKNQTEVDALGDWTNKPDLQERFWNIKDESTHKVVKSAFKNYVKWAAANKYRGGVTLKPGLLPGDFSTTLGVNGLKIGIAGLNTTFLQLGNGDYEGRLALSYRQFLKVCGGGNEWSDAHDACFLLTHHPPSWLDAGSQEELRSLIYPPGRFVGHLCGHLHARRFIVQSEGGAKPRRLLQGASLFGLDNFGQKSEQRYHGYWAGKLELKDGSIFQTIWAREAVKLDAGPYGMRPANGFGDNGRSSERLQVTAGPLDAASVIAIRRMSVLKELHGGLHDLDYGPCRLLVDPPNPDVIWKAGDEFGNILRGLLAASRGPHGLSDISWIGLLSKEHDRLTSTKAEDLVAVSKDVSRVLKRVISLQQPFLDREIGYIARDFPTIEPMTCTVSGPLAGEINNLSTKICIHNKWQDLLQYVKGILIELVRDDSPSEGLWTHAVNWYNELITLMRDRLGSQAAERYVQGDNLTHVILDTKSKISKFSADCDNVFFDLDRDLRTAFAKIEGHL